VDTVRGTPFGTSVNLAFRGDRPDNLYLVSSMEPTVGDLYRFDGQRWDLQTMPDPLVRIYDVRPFEPGVAFAVGGTPGGQGVVVTLENGLWALDDSPTGASALLSIGGHRADSLVAVSAGGKFHVRHLAPNVRYQGWGTGALYYYGISPAVSSGSRPLTLQSLGARGLHLTYHDDVSGSPMTRMFTWSGWWWTEVNSVWGAHTPRILMPETDHLAYVTSNAWNLALTILDHGSLASTRISTDGIATDMSGTSLQDVLVLTTRKLFRMSADAHVGIPGPWDDDVILKAVWTDGPHLFVAGRSLSNMMVTVVYRGVREAW
jgi:hypothetical protein